MNFSNLEYFIAAAEELNFTRAARKLYISQQSLSNHIAKIEAYFGVLLFDRTPPMTLTPAGQCLLQNARAVMSLQERMERQINDIRDFRSGMLTIGVTHARGTVILPAILPAFRREFPQIRLFLFEGTSGEIADALYKGKVDMTIGFPPDDAANVASVKLQEERSIIIVPKRILSEYFEDGGASLLAERDKKIPLTRFRGCPFVAIKPTTWAGEVFEACCREYDMTPDIVVETANIATLVSLCLSGMGVAVCPRIFVSSASLRRLHANDSTLEQAEIFQLDYAPTETYIAANYLKDKFLTRAAVEFIRLAKAVLSESGAHGNDGA